jgi:hypothetical protein
MRSSLAALFVAVMVVGIPRPASVWAQDAADFAGRWTLNRGLSEFPSEVGFGLDLLATGGPDAAPPASGGRGRRGSGGGGGARPFAARPESLDDARRLQQLTAEVRNPSAHLTIVQAPNAVTFTDDRGQSRTFHPDLRGNKEEELQLDQAPVGVTAKWEAGRLVVLYSVEQGRELRYTYSRVASPPQLVVDVQFIERGSGDKVRRVYEPAGATEPVTTASAASSATTTKPVARLPAAGGSSPGRGGDPASAGRLPAPTFNQQPDAELKGLTKLGMVVEDLSPQAAACGLNQKTLESAVSKRLSDAGFRVLRNSDEDTYIYVNVITTSLSTGLCVSRYDVFLYTHTTAKLSYQETPVLVQVSLLHKGGIAGGPSAAHAEGVLRGVQEYVDQFSTRIHDASK